MAKSNINQQLKKEVKERLLKKRLYFFRDQKFLGSEKTKKAYILANFSILSKSIITVFTLLIMILPLVAVYSFGELNNNYQIIDDNYNFIKKDFLKTTSSASSSSINFEISNIPKVQVYEMNIPFYKQIYPLSCEAASLQMALAFFGINKTQDELLYEVGRSKPYNKENTDSGVIWGDPNYGFVGDVNGKMFNQKDGVSSLLYGTGWGVNNGPIAKIASKYKTESVEIDSANIENIRQSIKSNKPVIFWHQRDDARKDTLEYLTPEGKKITMIQNHVALIRGMRVENINNTDIITYYINDPLYGQYSITEENFIKNWNKYNNEIVIVG